MNRREHAHAQVEVLAVHGHFDAAVLRAAFLADVDAAHDLEARQQRGEQPPGRRIELHQHSIDPIADPHAVREWLNMDVRRT